MTAKDLRGAVQSAAGQMAVPEYSASPGSGGTSHGDASTFRIEELMDDYRQFLLVLAPQRFGVYRCYPTSVVVPDNHMIVVVQDEETRRQGIYKGT